MSTQLDRIARKNSRECNLWSPLREFRTAGSTRGDERKRRTASRLVSAHPPKPPRLPKKRVRSVLQVRLAQPVAMDFAVSASIQLLACGDRKHAVHFGEPEQFLNTRAYAGDA